MKVVFTFPADKVSIESDIIVDSYSRTDCFYNDNLEHADDSCKFNVPYSVDLANEIQAQISSDIKATVKSDSGNIFTGYLRKSATFTKTQKNQPISIEIVSPSYLLDKELDTGKVYIEKSATYIITDLLSSIGFTDIKAIGLDDKIVPVVTVKSGDNVKTTIGEICFEYNKCYDFDNNGFFYTSNIFELPDSKANITQTLDGTNLIESIQVEVKEKSADYISAKWNKIEKYTNTLLFSDTEGQTTTYKCYKEIPATSYFAKTQYNYCDYDSTLGTVVYTSDITKQDLVVDSGITYTISRLDTPNDNADLGTQFLFSAYNKASSSKYIKKFDVYGDAYINVGTQVNVSSTGAKEKEITLSYLDSEDDVKAFVLNLANYYRYANFTIEAKSKADYPIGTFVKVSDTEMPTYYGRIVQKQYKLSSNTIEYKIVTIDEFTPAVIVKTQNVIASTNKNIYQDFDAPTIPSITSINIDTSGYIHLAIGHSTDSGSGVDFYKIYRKTTGTSYCLLAQIEETSGDITYIDKSVESNTTYFYTVCAVDKVGNVSDKSSEVSILSTVTIEPNLATSLTAIASTSDYIKLTWTSAATDSYENAPAYYNVYISRDSGTTWTLCDKCYQNTFYYYYNRGTDGYPEKATLDNYKFKLQTVSIKGVSSSLYAITTVANSTYGTWIPSIPVISSCVAEENGIKIVWTETNSNYYGDTSYTPVIKYSGTARATTATKETNYFYSFDRTTDKYPEKSTLTTATYKLNLYAIFVTATDIKSGNSSTSSATLPDETNYKQWFPEVPTIESNVVGRCATLIFTPNVKNYGNVWKYRVQIKKISDVADTEYYKPDVSTDPYSSLTAYKNGSGYYTTSTSTFQQTLPLNGQNDTNPSPVNTSYQYSVIAENESGVGTANATQTITALSTGATDIVNSAITENKIADGAITADKISAESITGEKIAAMDLSATKAYFSKIAGNKGADSNNFWSGLDTTTPEFRIGNDISLENSDSDSAEYIHYKPNSGIIMKVANFILTSVASIIKGVFRIKKSGNTDANSFMTVNPTDSTDDTTGTEKQTVKIRGTLFADNYYGTDGTANTNAPAIIIDKPDTGCIGIGDNGESQTIKIGMSRDYKTWSDFTNVHLVIQGDTKSTDFIGHLQGNADTATIADRASSLSGVGGNYGVPQFGTNCITAGMSDSSFDGSDNSWAHYLIFNHGDGSSYFHYNLRFPFWNVPQYQRQMGNTSSKSGWKNFITSENIGSQSVNHATTSTNLSGGTVDATSITDSGNARISGTLSVGGNSYFAETSFGRYNYFDADIILKQNGNGTNEYPSGNIRCGTSGVYMARPMCALSFYWNGSSIANKKSYNVSSITRIGEGQYRVLLTNPVLVDRINDSAGSALSTNTWYNRADNDEIKKINLPMSMDNIDCNTLNQCLMSITEINFSGISSAEYTIRGIGLTAWDNQRDTVVDVLKLCQGVISYYPRV